MSLLNDCVVVGGTVGIVVVAVCCGMDVECKRMWGCTTLIAPRWFERKERSTVFGEPHPPIQTHTHTSTCLVCATIATTCVCPLFGCVFVVCVTRGLAQSKHQALVMTIASSKQPQSSPCARLCALFMQQQCLVTCATWLFAQCHCRCRCVAVHSYFQTKTQHSLHEMCSQHK